MKLSTSKPISINLIFILSVALAFWLGSRYPQLNEKAMMGGDMPVMGISFDIKQEVVEEDPFLLKVFYHTINWIDTNKKGMMFGLLFGAALMTLFNLLQDSIPLNRWYSSFIGLLIGAPLGVCVNCAAPIAKGMRDGGSREETALATMISSPTMNFIVLAMLFSLLPNYMAWVKISTTLLFALFGIPILTKLFPSKPSLSQIGDFQAQGNNSGYQVTFVAQENPSWLTAFGWFLKNYSRAFWYLIKTAVPLMLLAGLLGNILISIVPFEEIIDWVKVDGGSGMRVILIMIGLGLIGAFLPVPMTFDVIIVVILHAAGLPAKYLMVLLFTLGSVSIYSYLITRQTFSKALSLALFLCMVGLGLFNGVVGHFIEKFYIKTYQRDIMKSLLVERHDPVVFQHIPDLKVTEQQNPLSNKQAINFQQITENASYRVESTPYLLNRKGSNDGGNKPFENISALDLGIDLPYSFSAQQIFEPMARGGSIASDDVNLDGWEDLLVVSSFRLNLFLNGGSKTFYPQSLDLPDTLRINNAVLTDLNEDGWVDILFSTYYQGIYAIHNQQGDFFATELIKLIDLPLGVVDAFGIGDLNADNRLDIVLGISAYGGNFRSDAEILSAQNLILMNNGPGGYQTKYLEGTSGETLSVLIADLNQDRLQDVILGNDFYVPDYTYLGGQESDTLQHTQFKHLEAQTRTTMSISIADIDNDLNYELFEVQSGFIRNIKNIETVLAESPGIPDEQLSLMNDILSRKQQIRTAYLKRDFFECDGDDDWDCIYSVILRNAMFLRDSAQDYTGLMALIPEDWWAFHKIFPEVSLHQNNVRVFDEKSEEEHPNTVFEFPVLLQDNGNGIKKDVTEKYEIKDSGWAWNAKFADLDNDQWQDLLIANGFLAIRSFDSNIFYRNLNGEKFEDATEAFQLGNSLPIGAYAYFDYDHDGDLDIFMLPQIGPLLVYENQNLEKNHSIMIELVDGTNPNQYAIGAEVIIKYGRDQQQSRQILKSGGFKSIDPRILHFGLGKIDRVSEVIVNLPSGKTVVLNEEFQSNHRYQIFIKEQN
ncbi:MAG: FG-GAP-like repeat-containing protein [Cytophagales bacterium]|nr:FG-GAP-like repeat-containing protein [Cytophagales bacterium]